MIYNDIINEAARTYNIDPKLIMAMVQAESGGNPRAVSKAGAGGLMQLMPETAKELGVSNVFDPQQNIMGGVKYLSQLQNQFGSPQLAAAAYNAGPGNVRKYGGVPPFPETQNYIKKIFGGNMPFQGVQQGVQNIQGGEGDLTGLLGTIFQQSQRDLAPEGLGSKIGNILGALSEVAGAFHSPQAQERAQQMNMLRQQQGAQKRSSAIENLLGIYKATNPDPSEAMKSFSMWQQYPEYKDFLKTTHPSGGMGGIYDDPMIQESIKQWMANFFKGNKSNGENNTPPQGQSTQPGLTPQQPAPQQVLPITPLPYDLGSGFTWGWKE
jgi:hypothetical protein